MIKYLLLFFLLMNIVLANGVGIIDSEDGIYLNLINSGIQIDVESQVALVTSTQTFKNQFDGTRRVKYGFPLPASANATRLRWNVGGVWYEASFAPVPQDTTLPGPGETVDEDLKAYLGDTPVYYDIMQNIEPDSILIVEISFVQLLSYEFGVVDFVYTNNYSKIQTSILDKQEINFNLLSPRTIDDLNMLSAHDNITVSNEVNSANLHSVTFEKPADEDYHIQYRLSLDELGLFSFSTMLPHDQTPDSYGGFFVYIAEPDPSETTDIISKYFTIIIDRSGSMYGDQAKNAATFIVNNLNEEDRFNIVDFASNVSSFRTSHVEYNASNKDAAVDYISGINATNSTNISGAFDTALMQFSNAGENTANIIIFLTDGEATIGVTNDDELITHINGAVQDVGFCFGIGDNVQKKVLTSVSSQNSGFAEFLEDDILEERITGFYLKIRNPVLLNTSMSFSSTVIAETYPDPLPNLYKGQQMIVSGRYAEAADVDVTLNGNAFGEDVSYDYALQLADSAVQQYRFLPKIWAKLKIEHLLVQYYLLDETSAEANAVRDSIIDVSIDYGVISPFTSFGDPATDIEEAKDQIVSAIEFELLGNYPNPFNPSTTIQFKVNTQLNRIVKIKIFDSLGRLVKILSIMVISPGYYEVIWDGRLENGVMAASGNYFYLVDFGEAVLAGKMQLLK